MSKMEVCDRCGAAVCLRQSELVCTHDGVQRAPVHIPRDKWLRNAEARSAPVVQTVRSVKPGNKGSQPRKTER